jgi:abequosyltransferase
MSAEEDQEAISQAVAPSGAVFLSYASEDLAAAERIAARLRTADIEVWSDKSELRGGNAWDRQIRKQIHDCALFMPIISSHSQARLEGYFRREWKLAVDRTHDMAEEKAFLVPVVIDDTSERLASVPETFREVQWTRLPNGETSAGFVERVRRLATPQPKSLKLSLCISTFNRAAVIGETLENIIAQATNDCEIVVLNGGSTDHTERVVTEYASRFDRLRYVRQDTNNGADRDYDRAVEVARGEYCWLMSDDDLLKPGAVAAVLKALRRDFSLLIVNAEVRDTNRSNVPRGRWLNIDSDRVYGTEEMDHIFSELGNYRGYIGWVVIRRAIWLARDRQRHCGSLGNHLWVIFQERLPGKTLMMAETFISFQPSRPELRPSNSKIFERAAFTGPSLVWSLALSEWAKKRVCLAEPWRSPKFLLWMRAMGSYTLTEYQRSIRPRLRSPWEALTPTVIAVLPGVLANTLLLFYFVAMGRHRELLPELKRSPLCLRNWLMSKREGGPSRTST